MQKEKFDFFNIPKKYAEGDYKDAIEIVIGKYSKSDALLSIYDWGNPSIPGISDLDIVFVFRKNAMPLPFPRRSFLFLGSKVRYLARHPFVFIDEECFRRLHYIYPNAGLTLLHGKNIEIGNLSNEGKLGSEISLLNDIAIRHYPRDFLEQYCSRRINVRDTLLRLNSLRYTISSLEKLTGEKTPGDGISRLVENLRKKWFAENDFELLLSLIEDAIGISMDIIENFNSFLIKKGIVNINSGSRLEYRGIKNKSLFVKNWDKEGALSEMKNLAKKKGYVSILPLELSAQLAEYSVHKGLISSYIRDNIVGKIGYSIKNKKVIGKRIGILNQQALLARKLRHSDFPAFFDFGYRNRSGINNMALGMLDRLRF